MKETKEYKPVEIELIYLDSPDIITTSADKSEGGWDTNGWT